jgi:hypothetical protein
MKLEVIIKIALVILGVYLAYHLGYALFLKLKISSIKASGNNPTEIDRINAAEIDNNVYWIYENEDKIIDVVKRYTAETYGRLKVAFYEMFGKDLTAELKKWLDAAQFSQIKHIAVI